MKTYKDIFDAVRENKTVLVITHYGNTRTYFKNEFGDIMERFNNCVAHKVRNPEDDSKITSTSIVEVI